MSYIITPRLIVFYSNLWGMWCSCRFIFFFVNLRNNNRQQQQQQRSSSGGRSSFSIVIIIIMIINSSSSKKQKPCIDVCCPLCVCVTDGVRVHRFLLRTCLCQLLTKVAIASADEVRASRAVRTLPAVSCWR